MTETKRPRRTILEFFRDNPWWGVYGSLASLLSLPLAVYFYFQSREFRDLTVSLSPTKASVVRKGTVSKLTTLYNGRVVETDISIAQIALWNAGNMSIKPENVLAPIRIQATNNIPILEATVQKKTRDVIGLFLDTTEISKGFFIVGWRILEENDGGIIQITYAGGDTLGLDISGVIEGQGQLLWNTAKKKNLTYLAALIALLIATALTVFTFRTDFLAWKGQGLTDRIGTVLANLMFAVAMASATFLVVSGILSKTITGSPFGF